MKAKLINNVLLSAQLKTLSYGALPLPSDTMEVKSGELYINKRAQILAEYKRTEDVKVDSSKELQKTRPRTTKS